jgi:putative transposase
VQKVRSAHVLLGNSQLFSMASFRNVYTSLLLVIAGSADRELARQVNYLKAENQVLRSRLPGRISLTERAKNRLIRFAKNLGSALNELATMIHPGTIRSLDSRSSCKSQCCMPEAKFGKGVCTRA